MSQTTPAQAVASGTQLSFPPPSSSPWASVVLTNLSPYVLALNVQGNALWHAPYSERRYDLGPTATPINVLPSTPAGALIPYGVGAQAQATWYAPGEPIVGTWPVALTPATPGINRVGYISFTQACPAGGATNITGMIASSTASWTVAALSVGAAVGGTGSSLVQVRLLDGGLTHELWQGTVFAGASSITHEQADNTHPGQGDVNVTGTLDVVVNVLAVLVPN